MPPKKTKIIQTTVPVIEPLGVLEEIVESDNEIQAPIITPKPKRVMTDKQKETLAKGREIAHERRMVKDLTEKKKDALVQRQTMVNEKKKAVEDALIKTAVAVKKKQLLEESRLAKYTQDIQEEIPDEVIKKIIRDKKIPPKPILRREEEIPNPFAKYYFLD